MNFPDYAAAYLLYNYIDRDLFRLHFADMLRTVLWSAVQGSCLPPVVDTAAVPAVDTADILPDTVSADMPHPVQQDYIHTEELSERLHRR